MEPKHANVSAISGGELMTTAAHDCDVLTDGDDSLDSPELDDSVLEELPDDDSEELEEDSEELEELSELVSAPAVSLVELCADVLAVVFESAGSWPEASCT
jgi:hypothetical protein